MMDRSHSPRADSRGSFQSNSNNKEQASALSALFSSEMKMSYDARKEDEMEEKSLAIGSVGPPMPLSSSYHESYNYATASSSSASASFTGQSYNYAANSFYQSYGDSYQSLPKSLAAYGKKTEDESNGVSNGECKAGAKPLVSVKELLTIILEDATYKQDSDHNNNNNNNSNSAANSVGSAIDARLLLNGDVDVHSKIESLALLPAEEDGSPMEDLPDCTAQSDILNMGVKDFIILDKRSKIQLVHIRIEGNLAPNDPYEGVLPQNNQIQVVSEDDRPGLLQREESQQTIESNEDSYYTLDDDRDSWKDPDSIQFFRTDTDEIKLHELQRIMEEEKKQQQKAVEKPNKAHRHRSSSGNLVISYRRPNSQRWRVAKKLALLSEQLLIDHHHHTTGSPSSRLTSNDLRKSEIAQEVRKKLFEHQTQAVPIPDPRYNNQNHNLNKSYELPEQSSTTVNEGGGLDRRHSERPYDEERDGEFDQLKYSSKKDRDKDRDRDRDRSSRASSRASSFMDLNPHTSISLSAQFSPAGSEVMSSRDLDDSDDDQLGLIQLERSNYILSSASSTSNYTKRSLGRDESTYAHPFKSGSSGGHHNHNQNPVSPRHAAASRIRIGSFTKGEIPEMQGSPRHQHPRLPHRGSGASGNLDLNAKSILSMSDSEHSDSDDSDASSVDEDRFPIRQIHVNTDFKAITSNNNHNSSNNHQSPMRRSPSKLNPFRSPSMYEKEGGGDANSDNGSTRSSVTSNKSMISRLYDLFGTRRRSSFASESNDSVHSGPTTPHQRRSEIGSDAGGGGGGGYERPSLVLSRQISLPIIQNLDTGEAFPIGALRYEAFKLPETVSPTVLFGKPSDKIHR